MILGVFHMVYYINNPGADNLPGNPCICGQLFELPICKLCHYNIFGVSFWVYCLDQHLNVAPLNNIICASVFESFVEFSKWKFGLLRLNCKVFKLSQRSFL